MAGVRSSCDVMPPGVLGGDRRMRPHHGGGGGESGDGERGEHHRGMQFSVRFDTQKFPRLELPALRAARV